MQPERRIRSLKLKGSDNSDLRKACYILEEAFRTASAPGLLPNAVVLIRHLDLGTIHPNQPPVQLADTIAREIRRMTARAICIDERRADDSNVVWFSDPLRPCQMLLQRLIDGQSVDAWFWRALFPDQRLTLNTALLTTLLIKACQESGNGLSASLLLESCLAPARLRRLLALVTPALVRRVCYELGVAWPARSPIVRIPTQKHTYHTARPRAAQSIQPPKVRPVWRHAIITAATEWGCDDVRSRWLAWHALVLHHPAWLQHSDATRRIEVDDWLAGWSRDGEACLQRDAAGERLPRHSGMREQKNNGRVARNAAGEADAVRSASLVQGKSRHNDRPGIVDTPLRLPSLPITSPSVAQVDFSDTERYDPEPREVTTTLRQDPLSKVERVALFSPHAGFALVIPLLQRLAVAQLLIDHEFLIGLEFPRRLLWAMARRFALAEDDPAYMLFKLDFVNDANITLGEIRAPAVWSRLTRRSGRPLRPGSTASVYDLISTTQLAAAVYLRRHCGLSMRGLIQRPGMVALTDTHWDVLFDIDQTDLRLRRMALDSDPGWVPWLGKVVQFHYEEEPGDV